LFTLGIWLFSVQVLDHHLSPSFLQVYTQHWHIVSPAVLHLHFQSHPLILAFRIPIPGSAVLTPPFASSVLLPGSILTHMSCPIHRTLFDTHVVLHYPLGMGVPIVFHHVANQPHTPSPHFASFPYGLPDHLFMVLFFLPAPPQDHEPSISSTISLPICEPYLRFTYLIQKLTNGAPTLHQFSKKFLPSLGHSFHTGAPVSVFVHFPPKIIRYLLYKHLYFQSLHFLLSSPLATCFLFGHTQPMSPLVGALLLIYPCRHRPYLQSTPQVTYLYPLNLFTLSRLWHNLSSVLVSP
jgi:hypothetical protein